MALSFLPAFLPLFARKASRESLCRPAVRFFASLAAAASIFARFGASCRAESTRASANGLVLDPNHSFGVYYPFLEKRRILHRSTIIITLSSTGIVQHTDRPTTAPITSHHLSPGDLRRRRWPTPTPPPGLALHRATAPRSARGAVPVSFVESASVLMARLCSPNLPSVAHEQRLQGPLSRGQ